MTDYISRELIIKLNLADEQIERLVEETERLRRDLKDCRNELCLRCGAYKQRHNGACDGCRWRSDKQEATE